MQLAFGVDRQETLTDEIGGFGEDEDEEEEDDIIFAFADDPAEGAEHASFRLWHTFSFIQLL